MTDTQTVMALADAYEAVALFRHEDKRHARAALHAAVEAMAQTAAYERECLMDSYKAGEALRQELEDVKADAEKWRNYKARKDAVIAAGMGRNPLRDSTEQEPDEYNFNDGVMRL
jgi:hypothetical protein